MPPGLTLPGVQRLGFHEGKALPEWNGRQIQESCRCLWVVGETWAEEPGQGLPELLWLVGECPLGLPRVCTELLWLLGPTGAPGGLPELLWLGVVPTGATKVLPELPWLGRCSLGLLRSLIRTEAQGVDSAQVQL